MKIPYLNFQTIAGFLMLLISGYAYGEEPLLLRGVVFMEAEGYASISSAHNRSGWLKVDQSFERNLIKEIKADRIIIVTPNNDEKLISLAVAKPGVSVSTGSLISIEQLNWPWINSTANVMRKEAPDLPYEIANGWGQLSDSERLRIENYYRIHGWGIKVERKASQLLVTRYHLRAPDYYKKIDPDKFVTAEKNSSVMKK